MSCHCTPPPLVHVRPDGIHLPDGSRGGFAVEERPLDPEPECDGCGAAITGARFQCSGCAVPFCWRCFTAETLMIECDCGAMPQLLAS